MVPDHRRQGGHGHAGALQRLDPADEQQQRATVGQAQGPAGLGPVARAEEGVVDAGGHDPDPVRVGAVELGELGGLDRARRQHDVRAAHDRRLGLGPDVPGRRSTSSGLASAFTRARVWKVDTSGRSSSCLMVWPAMPDSQ